MRVFRRHKNRRRRKECREGLVRNLSSHFFNFRPLVMISDVLSCKTRFFGCLQVFLSQETGLSMPNASGAIHYLTKRSLANFAGSPGVYFSQTRSCAFLSDGEETGEIARNVVFSRFYMSHSETKYQSSQRCACPLEAPLVASFRLCNHVNHTCGWTFGLPRTRLG